MLTSKGKSSLVAIIKGTQSDFVTEHLLKIDRLIEGKRDYS